MVALFSDGASSSHIGCKLVIFTANLINVAAMILFAPASSAERLGAARMVQGFGASFSGAFRNLLPRTDAHDRAGLLATFYVESYLTFSLPVILARIVIFWKRLRPASL